MTTRDETAESDTDRLIDYRRTGWGHNLAIRQADDGLLRGHVWHRSRVRVGDKMIWRAAHGTTTGEVVECHPCMDPDDMYRVVVKVVDRCVTSPREDQP